MERRAKKSDCRATTRGLPNTPPFFLRRRRRRPCTANPIRCLLLFLRAALIITVTCSYLSKKYHDYFNSRWYCRPIDEVAPGVILYFILSYVSYGYVAYIDSRTCLKIFYNSHTYCVGVDSSVNARKNDYSYSSWFRKNSRIIYK